MMMVTPSLWVIFLIYNGKGSESFNWKLLAGMIILFIGVIWYIKAERDVEEEQTRNDYL